MSVQDEIVARIAKMHHAHTGMAYELMLGYIDKHPDCTFDECWAVVRFAGQQQKKIDTDQRQHSNSIDAPDDDTPAVPAYDDGRPGTEFVERHQLKPFAKSHFEKRIAQMAVIFSDDEIARRLDKPVKIVKRTLTILAKRSGRELYAGPKLTRAHDSTIRACIREGFQLFYVEFAGGWRIVEKESLTIDVSTLEPWHVQPGDDYEDQEKRIWYHDFDRPIQYVEVLCAPTKEDLQ